MSSPENLKEAILDVVAFFDLFDHPLTAYELWRYLPQKVALTDLISSLGATKDLDSVQGLYFFKGRQELVVVRRKRYHSANRKLKRASKVVRFLAVLPSVTMVAVGNQIGAHNSRDHSDIDFFVLCRPGGIWLTRLVAAGTMMVLKLRPRPGKKRDTICLSFYLSESALDLSVVQIQDDIYFRYWLATLVPLYGRDAYARLIAGNSWLARDLPNWQMSGLSWRFLARSENKRRPPAPLRPWTARWEAMARRLQLSIMPMALKSAMNRSSACVINDSMLKLYTNDRREEIRQRYQKRRKAAAA